MTSISLHRQNKSKRGGQALLAQYREVRRASEALSENLSDADTTVQSMEDASPVKWHLAHVSWFFEGVILQPFLKDYHVFDEAYNFLFNSYYEVAGERQPRPRRGMLTRPSLGEVLAYRQHIDTHMGKLLAGPVTGELQQLVELGLNHEQQHQELLLTDILHLFAQNPLKPCYRDPEPLAYDTGKTLASGLKAFGGGLLDFGAEQSGAFHFDCEGPRHKQLVHPFNLARSPVTNREWIGFIEDSAYENPLLWLSDGWAAALANTWSAPLYWEKREDGWWSMTLRGMQPVDLDAPVCHVSYFEAEAYATWAGKRLPTEFELELAAADQVIEGNFSSSSRLRPAPVVAREDGAVAGLYGDVWEWTSSSFSPYRGFKPFEGMVGEYNGKFMSGQQVLRGGSCATPCGHMRSTYRNFWHPQKRWQFTGLRLAEDS
ncbi:MAG: hypothetical protein COB37_08905 [Kordiimonadales bacterium]|nr:MAG: hypothetical protein COB37_08905 [Kordiimonadales bacterium]